MAGKEDRVHGYNPKYRNVENSAENPQFAAFSLERAKPLKFEYHLAVQRERDPTRPLAYANDHQGHIVPQGLMNRVLDRLMLEMSKACNTRDEVAAYITNHAAWMKPALDYGEFFNVLPGFFRFDAVHIDGNDERAEMRLGWLFSIITWNPVNICRAPQDQDRGNYPGERLDLEVRKYLGKYPEKCDGAWLAALLRLPAEPANSDILDYLKVTTHTLTAQQSNANGYYAFPWELTRDRSKLVPLGNDDGPAGAVQPAAAASEAADQPEAAAQSAP